MPLCSRTTYIASGFRTGRKEEALLASEEVETLAQDVLSKAEFSHANEIAMMLVSSKSDKGRAIAELTALVSPPPKRPLYYAQHELKFLPRWTRDAIRYMGDYLDLLTKHLTYALVKDHRVTKIPFGASVDLIARMNSPAVPSDLIGYIRRYNSFLYRPGKHEFMLPGDRRGHRFTSKEVVLTAFVTMRLADSIKAITQCDPELRCHYNSI